MNNISYVVANDLCTTCGLCYSICPEDAIEITGHIEKTPRVMDDKCTDCKVCIKNCPGLHPITISGKNTLLADCRSCYVGYSSDDNIRFSSASGGIVTALNILLLKEFNFDGVVCVRQSRDNIFSNDVILASSREDILTARGSRYAPVYACRGMKDLSLGKGKKYAFVGKPCDIQAVRRYEKSNRGAEFFTIAIFCAHTPSMYATNQILEDNGINAGNVDKIEYRGNGWPGFFTAYAKNKIVFQKTYSDVWRDVFCKVKYQNKRCVLCHDCTGESADISVGDAWLDEYMGKSTGHSVVIARTADGEKIIQHGINKKYFCLDEVGEAKVIQSQQSLLDKKRNIYIKNMLSRMIAEKVPEEKLSFSRHSNDVRRIPGFLKLLLLIKIMRMVRKKWRDAER